MFLVRYSVLFVATVLLFTSLAVAQSGVTERGETQNIEKADQTPIQLRKKTFEDVSEYVSLFCFDQDVCGKKWDELKLKYEPRVALVKNDDELHILLQTMLNELNTSHLRIIPSTFEDMKVAHPWGIGVELEIIDSQLVLSKVHKSSPAENGGLRAGFVITKINDKAVDQLMSTYRSNPLWGGKNWKNTVRTLINLNYLNGAESSEVNVEFLDEKDAAHRALLARSFKNPPHSVVESKMLEGGIGYIKLSVFSLTSMPEFCAAVRSMNNAPAIILDLRDNPGGIVTMSEGIMGLLASKPVKVGRMFKKDTLSYDPFANQVVESYPQAKPYTGKLIVLINEASGSTSEILSSSLQESGRAIVVGKQSMGEVMASTVIKLPTPALLQLAVSDFETANGVRLEGKGVTPDIIAGNGRKSLLAHTDDQLGVAIHLIKKGEIFKDLKPTQGKTNNATKSGETNTQVQNVSSAPTDSKAEKVLDQYTLAVGGKAVIEKLYSRVVSGTVKNSLTGVSGKFTIYDKTPGHFMMVVRYDDGTIEQEGFDGTDGWTFHSLLGFKKYEGGHSSKLYLRSSFYPGLDPAASLKRQFGRTHFLQEQALSKDKAAYLIGAGTGDDNDPIRAYFSFDKKTGLLIKGMFEYDDYRRVDGVQVPFSIKVEKVISYTVDQVLHNVEIPDGTFDKPVPSCFTTPN